MSLTRPKRGLQQMCYTNMMKSGSEDNDSANYVSDKDLLEQPKAEDEEVAHDVSSDLIRLSTASDILETESRILRQTAKIAAVDAEYNVMEPKMAVFEAKRLTRIDELLGDKAYLARIRTLPQEILGIVFLFYTSDPAQSPWTLMQVTRVWRATALTTPSLWSKIAIASPTWQKTGGSRWKDGREMCGTKAQLYRALRRAGNTPLDLQFALSNPLRESRLWEPRYREYDNTAFYEMICLLVSSRKCLRVHHLEIEGYDSYQLKRWDGVDYTARRGLLANESNDEFLDAPVLDDDEVDMGPPPPQKTEIENDPESSPPSPKVDDLEFPELRTLRVKSRDYINFVMKISQTSKLVSSIDYVLTSPGEYAWSNTPSIGLENFTQYPSLVSLSLNGDYFKGYEVDQVRALKRVLDNALSLVTLKLTWLQLDRGLIRYEDTLLHLPNLQHLVLKHSRPWSLVAPNLTTLSLLEESWMLLRDNSGENNFPLLTTLIVDWSTGTYNEFWYSEIIFPPGGLHTLDVCFGTRKILIEDLFKYEAKLYPVIFHLRNTVVATELLIKLINVMDRLEELHLVNIAFKKEFFDFLGSNQKSTLDDTSDEQQAVLANCPKLVRLQVTLEGCTPAQDESLRAAAKKAGIARIKAGIAMERWLIRSSEDQKWLNCLV